MNILLSGYTGRMGKMMQETVRKDPASEITAFYAIDSTHTPHSYTDLFDVTEPVDVLIDFSSHLATNAICKYCSTYGIPAVICTTGQSETENALIQELAKAVPVFQSGNMSLGIAVLTNLVKETVRMFPDADIEIVEKHHNQKLDVPSGTALMLAEAARSVRPDATFNIGRPESGKRHKNEIGIHSLRMGNEVGTHEIYINNGNECITLTHEANSRAVFADGALLAAKFLVNQEPGLYTMKELVNA